MMAYQNNYVVSLLHKDRPVREFSENNERACVVPFGSEYKVRLKNKTHKRCKVKVFIDGMDTNSDGNGFVLAAYQSLDLERFVDDLKSGRKFKFISVEEGTRTGEIQDPTSSENGLIRVEFHPETDWWYSTIFINNGYYTSTSGTTTTLGGSSGTISGTSFSGNSGNININGTSLGALNTAYTNNTISSTNSATPTSGATVSSTGFATGANFDVNAVNCSTASSNTSVSSTGSKILRTYKSVEEQTKGATVQGGESSQSFITVSDFATDAPTVITLKMRGPKSEATDNLSDAMKEINQQLENNRRLQQELEDLKRKVQPVKGFEVILKSNLIMVKLDGKDFTSSKETTIGISEDGLTIKGKGMDIKTKDYKLVTA